MQFPVLKTIRGACDFSLPLFTAQGNAHIPNTKNVRLFAQKINDIVVPLVGGDRFVKTGDLNALILLNGIFKNVCSRFCTQKNPEAFRSALENVKTEIGEKKTAELLDYFGTNFVSEAEDTCSLENILLLYVILENPAARPLLFLFDTDDSAVKARYKKLWIRTRRFFKTQPSFGPHGNDLLSMLLEPAQASPHSLKGQLEYIRRFWGDLVDATARALLAALDIIAEEAKASWAGLGGGQNQSDPPMQAYSYENLMKEYERFSPDTEWMPRVVLMAKTVLVWLDQLSKKYERSIKRLDEIPDEELDTLANRGFTGLWLIGVWKRSQASRRIKQINGNAEAAASAYSLDDYDIADDLGGWEALGNLRARLWQRGIRLAADMVPNHTGMDSKWVIEKPHLFVQRRDNPFPSYRFDGENLSPDGRVHVFLENGYFSKTDCAVVFKRVDTYTGDVRYIYHGNDGTGLPWNDTAQIDFLNPEAREEVIQKILHVARNFPIIRFDAAMVLAKKHIRRLWYPEPGHGGDIASRSESAISIGDFEKAIPNEFWREVVDRVAREIPDTLLLAEAFWMMEGYFVRTLGMHRVYNSAFMNMLKKEENYKYRSTIKNTLEFDPQVLKRFVNFMNNPDEETAAVQFGKGDKYFGVCTLMITMPGLPMFGHGQIEGFTEKYGMEFTRAYWNESDDYGLIERHNAEIFPLIKKRYLFSDVEYFRFYDVWNDSGVNENVFAYTNRSGSEATAVFYNNVYERAAGYIKTSCAYAVKNADGGGSFLRTEDFAVALNLTDRHDFYCIFREQKSGLSFIRSNRELFENGMFIQLNGFECQVLTDIREVCDDADGTYRRLCENLGGKGTADIEAAVTDLYLKDLYEPLCAFASQEFFRGIGAICLPHLQPKDAPEPPALENLLTQTEKSALAYFEALHAFFDGGYGALTVLPAAQLCKKVPPEKTWKHFCTNIKNLVHLCTESAASKQPLMSAFFEGFASQAFMPQIISAYYIITSVRGTLENLSITGADKIIDLWKIENKVLRILTEYGYPPSQTELPLIRMRELHLLYELLSSDAGAAERDTAPKVKGRTQPLRARTQDKKARHTFSLFDFAQALIESEKAPLLLGVNLFENVQWFNRERALETSWTACMLYVTEKGVKTADAHSTKSAPASALKVKQKIDAAIENSAYKTENLLTLLRTERNAAVKKSAPSKKDTEQKKSAKRKNGAKEL